MNWPILINEDTCSFKWNNSNYNLTYRLIVEFERARVPQTRPFSEIALCRKFNITLNLIKGSVRFVRLYVQETNDQKRIQLDLKT